MTPSPDTNPAAKQDPLVGAVHELTELLNRIGDALTAVDAEALLAAEAELGRVVAAVHAIGHVGDRLEARAAARQAQAALLRCRRLGASFTGMARAMALAGRAPVQYDRAGAYVERAIRSSLLIRA